MNQELAAVALQDFLLLATRAKSRSQNIFTNSQFHDFWCSSSPKHLRTKSKRKWINEVVGSFDRAALVSGGEVMLLETAKARQQAMDFGFLEAPSQKNSRGLPKYSSRVTVDTTIAGRHHHHHHHHRLHK